MCNRLVTGELNWQEYRAMFRLARWPATEAKRSFNLTPKQQVPVVRTRHSQREGIFMRWGLVPYWAKGVPPRRSTINAGIETLDPNAPKQAVSYRRAWKQGQRCVILANGFYEWRDTTDGNSQPYYIRPNHSDDSASFLIAGLWDSSTTADGVEILSCTIITTSANELMAEFHPDKQQMPAILQSEDAVRWLNGTPESAWCLLKPYPVEQMIAYAVSHRVNSPNNNGAELIEPLVFEVQSRRTATALAFS